MLPCFYYIENRKNKGFSCPYKKQFEIALRNISVEKEEYSYNLKCPCFVSCKENHDYKEASIYPQYAYKANSVVNIHNNGNKIEICKYASDFKCNVKNENAVPHSRNWKMDEEHDLFPLKKRSVKSLERSMESSSKRALDMCKGYLENNPWRYFITLTFSSKFVDRFNKDDVKYEWKLFRQSLQRFDKNVKIFCCPERHESGALHLHALVYTENDLPIVVSKIMKETFNKDGTANMPESKLKYFLFPIVENGEWKRTRTGDLFYALSFFNKGRNFTSILDLNNQQSAVKNYLGKYITKAMDIGYGSKRYFVTRNLESKDKVCLYLDDEELEGYIEEYGLKPYKLTDNVSIYRNFNIKDEF